MANHILKQEKQIKRKERLGDYRGLSSMGLRLKAKDVLDSLDKQFGMIPRPRFNPRVV